MPRDSSNSGCEREQSLSSFFDPDDTTTTTTATRRIRSPARYGHRWTCRCHSHRPHDGLHTPMRHSSQSSYYDLDHHHYHHNTSRGCGEGTDFQMGTRPKQARAFFERLGRWERRRRRRRWERRRVVGRVCERGWGEREACTHSEHQGHWNVVPLPLPGSPRHTWIWRLPHIGRSQTDLQPQCELPRVRICTQHNGLRKIGRLRPR